MSQRAGMNSSGRPVSPARRHFLAITATGAGMALTLLSSTAIAKNQQSNGKGALLDSVLGSGKDNKNNNSNNGGGGKDDGKGGNGGSGGTGNAFGQGGGNGGGGGGNNAGGNGNGNAYGLGGGGSVANSGGNGAGPFCFLKGTRILTSKGEVCVEDLRVGDHVLTVDDRDVEIRRIGRHTYGAASSSASDETMPIRISRFALDDRSPSRDLYVSPAHALLIDGYLMPAKDLVNGASIMPALPDGVDTVEYFHLVLRTHEVVLAEGVPAETLLITMGKEHESFRKAPEFRAPMTPYAPNVGYEGGRDHLKALLRLGMSSFVDVRDPLQRAYDRLAARAAELERRELLTCDGVKDEGSRRVA
ncbi:MAG: hypothetical protein JWM36_847 [Hyphomicrobiales bacterium]|nr:hypothetical protein [Hyphomicrobiales bacterium]